MRARRVLELLAGGTFTCVGAEDDGTEYEIKVVQDDDEGNVSWEVTGLR